MNCTDVYKALWGEDFINNIPVDKVKPTKYDKESKNSISFDVELNYEKISDADICSEIKKIFGIKSKIFDDKFKEACSGSGDEIRKITTLHSSSLCALLFFYNVSENPIEFEEIPNVTFNDVYFEFKTHVIIPSRPSNMDIVLMGYDKTTKEKVCFFLESKFSEYLSFESEEVGKSYWEDAKKKKDLPIYYNKKLLEDLGFDFTENDKGKRFIYGSPEECYASGIKQMISHFIGIHNYLNGNRCQEEKRPLEIPSKLYLGEILFDFGDLSEPYIKSYSEKYSQLAKILNEKIKDNQYPCEFKVLEKVLSYNELKKLRNYKEGEPKIYDYYFGGNSK